MKAYPEYKPSNIEWIGKIPIEWCLSKIKFTSYVKGRVGWHGLRSDEFTDVGPFLITGTDFLNGRVNWETCHHFSEDRYNEDPYIHIKENDLLITKDGTIGKVALVKNLPDKASLNSGIMLIRPLTNHYITDFMFWILNSKVFSEYIEYNKTGSTVQHLYQETFEDFSFTVPEINEQKFIVNFLNDHTQKIDNLIENKQKLIELLREERTVIINQAVTKGLNPDVPMRDSGIEWLGEIPVHWEIKKLKFTLKNIIGGGTPSTEKPEYWNGKIPWVSPKDMKSEIILDTEDKITDSALKNSSTTLIKSGAVLVVVRSGILKHTFPVAINQLNVAINQDMKALECNNNLLPHYLMLLLKGLESEILLFCTKIGATVDSIEIDTFINFKLPFPPIEEQQNIIEYIKFNFVETDRTISRIQKEIELLQEYRTALISEVVTGKIDVREAI